MDAKFAAGELLDSLTDGGQYTVHSVFSGGFNLRAGPFLGFVGNKREERLPFGILLRREDVERLPQRMRPGQTVFTWEAADKRLNAGEFSLRLGEAARYESGGACRGEIPPWALSLFDEAVDPSLETGLQATVAVLSNRARPGTEELCRCFGSREGERIRPVLKKWVGSGLGLTPSGDDFLIGVLCVDRIAPYLSAAFRRELERLIDEGYTTDIGVSYCRCALRGMFCGSLLAFGKALGRGDAAGARESLGKILRFGHTSGRDTAAGIRLGIQMAQGA